MHRRNAKHLYPPRTWSHGVTTAPKQKPSTPGAPSTGNKSVLVLITKQQEGLVLVADPQIPQLTQPWYLLCASYVLFLSIGFPFAHMQKHHPASENGAVSMSALLVWSPGQQRLMVVLSFLLDQRGIQIMANP